VLRRQSVIGISLAMVGALGLAACGGGGGDEGSSGSKTVRVTLANHVWTDNIKKALPDFEKKTGLKVEITQLGEDQLSDQYNVKLNAGSSDLDVMMYRPLQEGKLFAKNKYLADLTDKVKANADWNWGDFQAGPVKSTTYKDKVVGVPLITEQEVLYYRKDLLQKAGIAEPPKTLDELKADAQKVAAANPGVAGFVARTGKSAAVTQFSSFLYSFGGNFLDDSGKATINTPEAKQAYAFYGGLIKDFGPKNVSTDMSWPEAMAIFTQGKAAFYT
jgi:multiple sugar transport system substrate-binding protein